MASREAEYRLGYHPVVDDAQRLIYEKNRALFMELFEYVENVGGLNTPEKSLALTHLQEALMWLNAHVACNYQNFVSPHAEEVLKQCRTNP